MGAHAGLSVQSSWAGPLNYMWGWGPHATHKHLQCCNMKHTGIQTLKQCKGFHDSSHMLNAANARACRCGGGVVPAPVYLNPRKAHACPPPSAAQHAPCLHPAAPATNALSACWCHGVLSLHLYP